MADEGIGALVELDGIVKRAGPQSRGAVMVGFSSTMLCGAEDLQRPVDGRLLKMEEKGVEGCGLFMGAVHRVASAVAHGGTPLPGHVSDVLKMGLAQRLHRHFQDHGA